MIVLKYSISFILEYTKYYYLNYVYVYANVSNESFVIGGE